MSDRADSDANDSMPPIEWAEGTPPDESGAPDTPAVAEGPPIWAEALRHQLFGILVLVAAGFVAVGTTGIVAVVAETAAIVGLAVGLFGFYAWPRSASNNS